MILEGQWTSSVLAAGVLLACGLLIPGLRSRKAIFPMLIGGAIGAVAYPLAHCLFMGVAGGYAGSNQNPAYFWVRFRHTFHIYALSATLDAIPRGGALGMLSGIVLSLRRGHRAAAPRVA